MINDENLVEKVNSKNIVEPLVSVIIPVYNGEQYIRKAIDSVLVQEIPLEILIIDDCSTDNLERVIQDYQKRHSIKYFKNAVNLGVAETRNIGVKKACGKYIAFLDADDWWMPNKLEKQIELMTQKRCAFSYTARQIASDDGTLTSKIIEIEEEVKYNNLLYHNCIACSSVLMIREVALRYKMEHSDLHEDYLTWLRILKDLGVAYGINQPLVAYRQSKKSKASNKLKSAKMTYGVYRILEIGRIKALLYTSSHLLHGIVKFYIK